MSQNEVNTASAATVHTEPSRDRLGRTLFWVFLMVLAAGGIAFLAWGRWGAPVDSAITVEGKPSRATPTQAAPAAPKEPAPASTDSSSTGSSSTGESGGL